MQPLTQEQIRAMELKIQQMKRYDDRSVAAAKFNSEKLDELINVINNLLHKHPK
jgi:hypothetical protein